MELLVHARRTLGMTFGRPWTIPQTYLKLRRPKVFTDNERVVNEVYAEISVWTFNLTLYVQPSNQFVSAKPGF